jgi:hypothetical protein
VLEPRAVVSHLRNGLCGWYISRRASLGDHDDVFFPINVCHDGSEADTPAGSLAGMVADGISCTAANSIGSAVIMATVASA